jgi:cell division septum initiation protein DivIVA
VNQPEAHSLESALLELREMIETARTMPMSASVLVNRDEALDLLDVAMRSLPEELRHARWLLKERQEFLAQAHRDADDLVEAARVQASRMVERTELAREAKRDAQQVLSDAEADARRMRHEVEDYVEQRLLAFEGVLDRTMKTIRKGREKLQVPLPPPEPDPTDEESEGEFFDQDET